MSDDSLYPASLDSDIVLDQIAMSAAGGGTGRNLDGTGNWPLSKMLRRLQTGLLAVETKLGVDGSNLHAKAQTRSGGATVASTTAATSLLASPFDLPADWLTAAGIEHFRSYGHLLANAGTPTITFGLKIGAVSLLSMVAPGPEASSAGFTASASVHRWDLDLFIDAASVGATGTVHAYGYLHLSMATAAALDSSGGSNFNLYGGGSATIDTTADHALDLTAQPSASSAAVTCTCDRAALLHIPGIA